jgi:hypothetical protein
MRVLHLIWLAGLSAILAGFPAFAASDGDQVHGRAQLSLGDFDVVIADTGDAPDGWNTSPTHVYVQVLDGRDVRDMYFDSLPAAVYVLRELYGTPRILRLLVPEYNGSEQQGGQDGAWIDGLEAYYVWDDHRYCRGNLPLVLAFGDYRSAVSELLNREGELMSFDNLVTALYGWADDNSRRIYWRGAEQNRWDNEIWNQAWENRWTGWSWDYDHGWGCPGGEPGHDGHGHDGPGHPPWHDDGGNPGPPPGPPPGSSPDYHHEHDNGDGWQDHNGNNDANNHGHDQGQDKTDANKQTPRVRDDANKQTPRVKDDDKKPSGGEKGAGNTDANKPPPSEKGGANKQAPREKDDGKQPSGGEKGAGDKGSGDKGGGGKGSGRVK